ncbi:MAG: hypothetical protein LC101_10125 [Flavobacteriales bacterium]|nr:hypothetical protein [Flavobacteriales bacterium]
MVVPHVLKYDGTGNVQIAVVDLGDCIDFACVRVCPTGIDIRNGTQLECVNCTACMDACDAIMDSIGKPRGLIRLASENSIRDGKKLVMTRRIKVYTLLLLLLIGFLGFLLASRSDVDARLMRTAGMTYNSLPDGRISNLYNLKLINKSRKDIPVDVRVEESNAELQMISLNKTIKKEDHTTLQFFIILNRNQVKSWKTEIELGLYQNGEKFKTLTAKFIGPEVYE